MNGSHLVREARKRAGLSQQQLADRAGTTQSSIARLESGRTAPSLERLTELVRACGFDLEVHLVPHDDHDWALALQGLERTDEERVRTAANVRRFVEAGRQAMADAGAS